MKLVFKIIPCFYSEYGRYITKLRAIPSHIDCLKPVERRCLLGLYEKAKDKKVKSAKVIGTVIANWHCHGDLSTYGTLVNLVQNGYAIGQGNWGSPGLVEDSSPAAPRYTEVKLEKWVVEIAFKYHKFVPWEEIELDPEPVYLPCPVPLGLIGEGIIQGISFHRTVIPKYKFKDLIKRCIYLLENDTNSIDKCIIKPSIKGCITTEAEKDSYKKLLTDGEGVLNIIPNGNIDKKYIEIFGRSPFKSFNGLIKAAQKDKKTKKKKLEIYLDDLCDQNINIRITPEKPKKTNLNNLATKIWNDYLISKSKFTCYVCNEQGLIELIGIDKLILNSYHYWKLAVLNKKIHTFNKFNEKKFENAIIQIIRYIFEQYKSHKVDDIIKYYKQLTNGKNHELELDYYDTKTKQWSKVKGEITEDDIKKVCKKKSIQALIEQQIDEQKITNDLIIGRKAIDNNDVECLNEIKGMI